MGMISPVEDGHPLPWFRQDHRLQRHKLFHVGLKVGFCGCLTTCTSNIFLFVFFVARLGLLTNCCVNFFQFHLGTHKWY